MLKKILFAVKFNKIIKSKYKINKNIALPIIYSLENSLDFLCGKEFKEPKFMLERIFFLYCICYNIEFNVSPKENIRLYIDLWFKYYRKKFQQKLGINEEDQFNIFLKRSRELSNFNIFISEDDFQMSSDNEALDKIILYWFFLPLAEIPDNELLEYKLLESSKNYSYFPRRAEMINLISKYWPLIKNNIQTSV